MKIAHKLITIERLKSIDTAHSVSQLSSHGLVPRKLVQVVKFEASALWE